MSSDMMIEQVNGNNLNANDVVLTEKSEFDRMVDTTEILASHAFDQLVLLFLIVKYYSTCTYLNDCQTYLKRNSMTLTRLLKLVKTQFNMLLGVKSYFNEPERVAKVNRIEANLTKVEFVENEYFMYLSALRRYTNDVIKLKAIEDTNRAAIFEMLPISTPERRNVFRARAMWHFAQPKAHLMFVFGSLADYTLEQANSQPDAYIPVEWKTYLSGVSAEMSALCASQEAHMHPLRLRIMRANAVACVKYDVFLPGCESLLRMHKARFVLIREI
jgi:hypothetical protein